MVKLQESPDDMPPGQTPHTVIVYAHDDLVDAVQPGDRVYVTGIYRAVPMRVNPKVRFKTQYCYCCSSRYLLHGQNRICK